jgi:3-oxoadipate enol-lactonase
VRVSVGDCSLYCEVIGAGPPILFVHGFPLAGELWHETAGRLSGWRAIMPDLRGHGRSDVTPSVTIARFTDDLVALLDALGEAQPVVLVGLSMGGVIAFDFFRRHRSRLRALVLVGARPTPEPPEGKARREALAQAVLRDGSVVAADSMVPLLFGSAASPELRQHWHDVIARTPPAGVAAAARALADREDSVPTLPRIDCPTLIVFGEEDTITPVEVARQMHAAIAGSRLVMIPGAGHLPPIEQPDRFADTLRGFLAGLA